jgi:hypothetical protein
VPLTVHDLAQSMLLSPYFTEDKQVFGLAPSDLWHAAEQIRSGRQVEFDAHTLLSMQRLLFVRHLDRKMLRRVDRAVVWAPVVLLIAVGMVGFAWH